MSSCENDNVTSKANIMNATVIERSIDDWLSNDDKTIHYIMYADNKVARKASSQGLAGSFCSLFCSWKSSSSDDDQEYLTNLSTDIHKRS